MRKNIDDDEMIPRVKHVILTDKNGKPVKVEHLVTVKMGDKVITIQMS